MEQLVKKTLSDEEVQSFMNVLDSCSIYSGTSEVAGFEVSVNEESSRHSEDVVMEMYLIDYNLSFRREGTKEISYDNWVDTWWCSWVLNSTYDI